jgi:hypothetical protein
MARSMDCNLLSELGMDMVYDAYHKTIKSLLSSVLSSRMIKLGSQNYVAVVQNQKHCMAQTASY